MSSAEVREYWEERPCAARLATHGRGTAEFYAQIEAAKTRAEPHEAAFAQFPRWSGLDVLEIGCGVGIDTARFARAGAVITAVDLTEAGVSLANGLLELEQLSGTALVADAESLPFPDDSFDLVYSWGVLHHTPNMDRAVAEVSRVVKPGGEVRVMLYSRRSLFTGMVWTRQTLRERRLMTASAALSRGLESPGTKALTIAEVKTLFGAFSQLRTTQVATSYDRVRIDRLGWHLLVEARLDATPPI